MRRTVADALDVLIREDTILVEVGESASLVDECRWETVCIGLVMDEFGVHEIEDLNFYLETDCLAEPLAESTHVPLKKSIASVL